MMLRRPPFSELYFHNQNVERFEVETNWIESYVCVFIVVVIEGGEEGRLHKNCLIFRGNL